jgi:hypothetical protein
MSGKIEKPELSMDTFFLRELSWIILYYEDYYTILQTQSKDLVYED